MTFSVGSKKSEKEALIGMEANSPITPRSLRAASQNTALCITISCPATKVAFQLPPCIFLKRDAHKLKILTIKGRRGRSGVGFEDMDS